jgi:hypothetical protein
VKVLNRMQEMRADVQVDPEALAKAAKEYDAECDRIEGEYELLVGAAKLEWHGLYKELTYSGFSSIRDWEQAYNKRTEPGEDPLFKNVMRLIEIRRMVDGGMLKAHRDAGLKAAETKFIEATTPTPFERELFRLTDDFEQKTYRIQKKIAEIQVLANNLKEYPQIAAVYLQTIKGLEREAEFVAKKYSRDVELVKKERNLTLRERSKKANKIHSTTDVARNNLSQAA